MLTTSVVMFSMTAAVITAVMWAYFAGRKSAEEKAKVETLEERVKEAKKLITEINLVEEVKHEVAAMDDDELRDAGYQWVRNRRTDGR